MSLLTIVQDVCSRVGLATPNAAISSTDPLIQQIVALVTEEGEELAGGEYNWNLLQLETSFTTVATEVQGVTDVIAPGLKYIINDTIWNRTTRLPIYGPLSAQNWEKLKAMQNTGPWVQYVVREGNILFNPVPVAGQSCYFLYQSKNFVNVSTGGTSDRFVTDTDTVVFQERIMKLGTIWRWKAAKGLDFTTDYAKYEKALSEAKSLDTPKDSLYLDGDYGTYFPAVLVPSGTWGL